MTKLVVLAAGRGTRMRRKVAGVRLDRKQRRMADLGLKGLIPFAGHAYLDFVISAAADAGLREICLVVGPDSDLLRRHYGPRHTRRVTIDFATQERPVGNADAVLAAESFVAGDPFLVVNSDNLYPASAFTALQELDGSGIAGFTRDGLSRRGNIPIERLAQYAFVTTDSEGYLAGIVEKPSVDDMLRHGPDGLVSMTCWRFGLSIFTACRAIEPSPRGELELPDAVLYSIRSLGQRFRVLPVGEPVLDLSCREDIPMVEEQLRGLPVLL